MSLPSCSQENISTVFSLFRNSWLAVVYYRVHKDGKLKLKLKIEILTFLLNEFRKFYIHHENLETHLQASPLPKTIRIDNGDNDVGYLKV